MSPHIANAIEHSSGTPKPTPQPPSRTGRAHFPATSALSRTLAANSREAACDVMHHHPQSGGSPCAQRCTGFHCPDIEAREVWKEEGSEGGGGGLSGKVEKGMGRQSRLAVRDSPHDSKNTPPQVTPLPACSPSGDLVPNLRCVGVGLRSRKDPWIGRGGMQWRGCVHTTSSRVIDESRANFKKRVKQAYMLGRNRNLLG
ncbi:hypothetical protein B0H13DRAFT_2278285 [Mycena leptocephala]|nr:hypothetical protein B0H13DRAFT_2278285 [Mycena leptocephala]